MENNLKTEQDFKDAIKKYNIKQYSHRKCSMCDTDMYYRFYNEGNLVTFDNRCECQFQMNTGEHSADLSDLVRLYNEGNDETKSKMNEFFKFNEEDILDKFKRMMDSRITPEYLEQLAYNCYEDDRKYPENFSNWYYKIKDFGYFSHANIISNQIFTFDEYQAFQKCDNIMNVDWDELIKILRPTLEKMQSYKIYSIKNGCFSNKFEFQSCISDKLSLAKKLWEINYMASMYDAGGYTELVVREYISEDPSKCLTIYNGMPLRTEVRVFYNMDTKKIEYFEDYWNYDYCVKEMKTLNDSLIFNMFHNKIGTDLNIHEIELNKVIKDIQDNIDTLKIEGLEGIWSIDFMYDRNTDKIYLIDMARGFRSAYWNPKKLSKED